MPLLQLIILALVQGITEFLPISSSAHLILAPLAVKSWADQGPLIDVAAHVGSLFAVLLYFRGETGQLFRGGIDTMRMRESADRKLFLMIAAATIPILCFAAFLVLTDLIDQLRSPVVIGWTSIIFGILLWHGDRQPAAKDDMGAISWADALKIGAAQTLAVIPGVSRSGVTMTAARYLGWSRPQAARYSMLLAIPTISAFGLFAGLSLIAEGAGASPQAALIVAVLSFISAYAVIALFMRLTRSISFTPFVIYRLILGIILLIFADKLVA